MPNKPERKDIKGPEANEEPKIVFTHAGGGLQNDEPAKTEEKAEEAE